MTVNIQQSEQPLQVNTSAIKIIYILYAIGYFTGGLTSLVGVIMAYMNKGGATELERAHYDYLIKLFWISVVLVLVACFTWVFVIGMVVFLAWFVWSLIKIIKGATRLGEGKAPNNR